MDTLSKDTHCFVPRLSDHGRVLGWELLPYLILADMYPHLVKEVEGRQVFTGLAFVYLDGKKKDLTDWLQQPFITPYSTTPLYLDMLWGSNIKRGILTAYHPMITRDLLEIFNTAESGLRANGTTGASGNWSAVKLNDFKVGFFKDKSLFSSRKGNFNLYLVDGINYIHERHANTQSPLRRGLVYHPYKLGGWRLGIQMTQWITKQETVDAVVDELLPFVEKGLARINYDPDFLEESVEMAVPDSYVEELIDLNPLMADHPLANWWLSDHRASTTFDTITTGSPPDIQGFVAVPCEHYGVVIPQGENRFCPGSEMFGGGRYPQDSPLSSFVAIAERDDDFAQFLAECEGFQNRILCLADHTGAKWHTKGMTIVVPEEYWPEAWDHLDMVCGGEDIKAHSDWEVPQDIADSKQRERILTIERGYLMAVSWVYRGTLVGVHPDIWKGVGGDYDGDQGCLFPQGKFPQLFAAIVENSIAYEGLENPKLVKTHTFTGESRAERLIDSIEGGKMVGVASNIALILLHTDPALWEKIAQRLDVETYFQLMLENGYVKNADISPVAKLFRVIGFLIKVGTDGFKTSIEMGFWSSVADGWVRKVKKLPAYRLIAFNPRKNKFALRDNQHLPEYNDDEPVFGVAETLMKMAIRDGAGEMFLRLELPDYLFMGAPTESYKHFAVGPQTDAEHQLVRTLRRTIREEIHERNMTTPGEWALFKKWYLTPLVLLAMNKGVVVLEWKRFKKNRYKVTKLERYPELAGMSRERMANLMWWAFHEQGKDKKKNRPMSVAPVVWTFPEEVKGIVADMPGMANYQDEFTLPVIGTQYVQGLELDKSYHLKAIADTRIREVDGHQVAEKRTLLVFENEQYCMLPAEAPLLLTAGFNVVFRPAGKQVVGEFKRLVPVPEAIKARVLMDCPK
jgi:hypothetical protein